MLFCAVYFNISPKWSNAQYKQIEEIFLNMDVGAHYQLFAFIHERLPMRAKMMFCAEDYQGKRQTILEVMAHLCRQSRV